MTKFRGRIDTLAEQTSPSHGFSTNGHKSHMGKNGDYKIYASLATGSALLGLINPGFFIMSAGFGLAALMDYNQSRDNYARRQAY